MDAVQSRTFTTDPPSAVSISVPMATVERTTVTVVTAISEPNGRSQQVRLRHRTPPDTGARSAPQFGSSSTSTASIDITGLTSGSEYEVEATLASDFAAGVRSARFMTLPPAAESVDVSGAGITQTAATATVTIADPNGQPQTVRLRYRSPPGTGAWITAPNETSLDLTATFDLTRLIAGRRYEVEAALASNFSTGTQSTTFTTDAPTVDSVVVEAGSITQTSATIAVRVNNSNASEVDLRYRVDGTNSWSAIDSTPVAVCASSATFTLRSLTSGRTYRVEASYDITFRTATEFATFDTLAPAVTAVEIDDRTVTRTTAAVVLSVSTANGSDVHLRFSLDGLNWSMATPASVSPGESGAAFSLTGLTSGSEYTVQAAYDQLFRDGVKTRNFTTFPPTLIGIQATSAAETSASMEATIAAPNGAEQIVFLRYRTSGRSWSNPPQPASTRGASATFTLLGLSASTQYQLQASRDRSFNTGMQPTTFSTLSAGPSASQVSIENAEQTRVSARIAIANADGTEQTVRLRYRTPAGNGSWGAANPATSSNQEVTIDLTDLVSGSEYEVEATLAQSFTTGVQSRKFETDPPTVDSIEVVTKSALSATLDVNVEEPNGSDVHLRYGVSDTDSWTSADPRIVNRNASVARFNRSSLISGREYSVGASYDEAFQDRCVVTSDVFSTDPLRVDAVSEEEVTDTDAKIMVDVVAPNGAEVHLRYRSAGGSWQSESQIVAPLRNGNSPQGSATFTLSSLAPDTNYVVEASFDQFFAKDVKSTAFTTFETGFVAGPTIITGTGTGSGGGGGGGSGGGPPPIPIPSDEEFDWNVTRDIDALDRDNDLPTGIWSNGESMLVLDSVKDALFVYDLEAGQLLAEYTLDKLNQSPRGLWSDSFTIWVSDDGAKRILAYRVEDELLNRYEDQEFTFRSLLKAGNGDARGIWSDGDVIFVADELNDHVYTYNMPDAFDAGIASLTLSGIDYGEFSPGQTEYRVVVDPKITRTTVAAVAKHDNARVVIEPDDIDRDLENGHQVAVRDSQDITISVTSEGRSRTRVYTVSVRHCISGLTDATLNSVRFIGGSVDALLSCARTLNLTALYHYHNGTSVAYFLEGPAFINRHFRNRFADGLSEGAFLIVRREPAPIVAPSARGKLGPVHISRSVIHNPRPQASNRGHMGRRNCGKGEQALEIL